MLKKSQEKTHAFLKKRLHNAKKCDKIEKKVKKGAFSPFFGKRENEISLKTMYSLHLMAVERVWPSAASSKLFMIYLRIS